MVSIKHEKNFMEKLSEPESDYAPVLDHDTRKYSFKNNEILILLGAGCSFDAKIPHSWAMLQDVEKHIETDDTWKEFHDLYYYVQSAIKFADEMKGKRSSGSSYNIEKLVTTLDEIAKRNNHPLYPFIGAWNPQLIEILGGKLELISNFRNKIVEILRKEWVPIQVEADVMYYKGIFELQKQYQASLRVFTLNYDMCIEHVHKTLYFNNLTLERGFADNRIWDWRQFDDSDPESAKNIYLYKLHGSLDWKREIDGSLTYKDNPNHISPQESTLIFGTTFKLQYVDPFLFLAYEFRRWTLESKLILCIGYGFADDHINGIIGQALKRDSQRKVLSVSPLEASRVEERRKEICTLLGLEQTHLEQIVCNTSKAKDFLENASLENLAQFFSQVEEVF